MKQILYQLWTIWTHVLDELHYLDFEGIKLAICFVLQDMKPNKERLDNLLYMYSYFTCYLMNGSREAQLVQVSSVHIIYPFINLLRQHNINTCIQKLHNKMNVMCISMQVMFYKYCGDKCPKHKTYIFVNIPFKTKSNHY